jgi:plasmid stabilization system protein ParE
MDIRFSRDAMHDLQELKHWLRPLSPQGYGNVSKRLAAAIQSLKQQPNSGRPTIREDIRELVEPRYGFIVPYIVRDQTIWILRVYSARRYPLNYADFPGSADPA